MRSLSKRDLPINNRMRVLSAARNLRMRVGIRNGETAIPPNRLWDNCVLHDPPPASSRLRADIHRADASSPKARCFCPGSTEKRTENKGQSWARWRLLANWLSTLPRRPHRIEVPRGFRYRFSVYESSALVLATGRSNVYR